MPSVSKVITSFVGANHWHIRTEVQRVENGTQLGSGRQTLKASKSAFGVADSRVVELTRPSEGQEAQWNKEYELETVDY